ncbi:ras association domain-containing protein 10 [Drosophila takahashii]|uniref:ras association domain-containing protein 10 n=1 Tax=Drosophila takahashii TaxID=29030 RepID=UPI001CF87112|nr:ras association domain-containing protein 10 [Drosophila takahashii]
MTSEPAVNGFGPQSSAAPGDDDDELLSSLSDNLSIWIDGEEHWISGVDASTTCADLIGALISYQSVQQQHVLFGKAEGQGLADPQEFAIVQKQRHYEEYLDGSARLFDVITSRHALPKEEECQLQLRHLVNSTRKITSTTDKDSGMGSPVDSSRSMRFRRRGKHKVLPSTKITENTSTSTKQPKRSRKPQQRNHGAMTPNESLLTIILAQDETILQQMSMLHEKDRQILKIEEEKHRVRERELGKNYLLETYLKDLDEPQENGPPDLEDFEEDIQRLQEDDKDFQTSNDEIRLHWLEKIHAVNKQLQREEELLLSLHAKVRRHQVKRAYQTKSEVLLQIDRLDSELSAQVADIHRVERKLFTANEQLKAKLGVLECLGREFETTFASEVDQESGETAEVERRTDDDLQPSVSVGGSSLVAHHSNRRVSREELTDRNLKDRQILDKGLTKQMFNVSQSPDPPPTSKILRNPGDIYSQADIQHLGTLV